MKRIVSTVIPFAPLLVAGCAGNPPVQTDAGPPDNTVVRKPAALENVVRVTDAAGTVAVEKVPFRAGTSSTTVEKLARGSGCDSSRGAGLMTEKGPIEIYRMQCNDGRVFLARCELRQCKPMR